MGSVVDSGPGGADAASLGSLLAWGGSRLVTTSETPRLDAELLLAFATGHARSAVLAFPERPVPAPLAAAYRDLIARRAEGRSLAALTGTREFYSLPLTVDASVLVPRPETELLVDEVLSLLGRGASVLDLGTGSGAVALAIKRTRRDVLLTATDLDAAALAVARRNGTRAGLDVRWFHGDWFAAVPDERFDVIVSNPPYVPSDDPHLAGPLRFEPRLALDGGPDGLDAFRAILTGAREHLINKGFVALEHGADQRDALGALATQTGFEVVRAVDDLGGRPRVLVLVLGAP